MTHIFDDSLVKWYNKINQNKPIQGNTMTTINHTNLIELAFTSGDCDDLAMALHEKYGFPVYVFGNEHGAWAHMMVQHPQTGKYIDVHGAQEAWEIYDYWECTNDEGDLDIIPLIDGVHVPTDREHPTIPVEDGIALTITRLKEQGINI